MSIAEEIRLRREAVALASLVQSGRLTADEGQRELERIREQLAIIGVASHAGIHDKFQLSRAVAWAVLRARFSSGWGVQVVAVFTGLALMLGGHPLGLTRTSLVGGIVMGLGTLVGNLTALLTENALLNFNSPGQLARFRDDPIMFVLVALLSFGGGGALVYVCAARLWLRLGG